MVDAIEDDIILQRYAVLERLGRGAYGVVWKAVERETGIVVAIKKCFDAFHNLADAQRIYREVSLLSEVGCHVNVVQLMSAVVGENDDDVYLVFGHMESDLQVAIQTGSLHDIHKRYIACQLFRALKYLHSAGVLHRDIKPQNLLVDSSGHMRLCDFGMARVLPQHGGADAPLAELTDYVATRWYRPPECLLKVRSYAEGFDIWGAGCVLGELYKGRPMFPGTSTVGQLDMVMNLLGFPSGDDLEALRSPFVERMLESLPNMRGRPPPRALAEVLPSAEVDTLDLIQMCLRFNSWKRISAIEALRHSCLVQFHDADGELSAGHMVQFRDGPIATTREYRDAVRAVITTLGAIAVLPEPVVQAVQPAVPAAHQPQTLVGAAAVAGASPDQELGPMSRAAERVAAHMGHLPGGMSSMGPIRTALGLGVFFNFNEAAVCLAHRLFLWADRNKNARLERSEFFRLHEVFGSFIMHGEASAFVFDHMAETAHSADAFRDFQRIDCDTSDTIDEAEWMQYMGALFELLGPAGFMRLEEVLSTPNNAPADAPTGDQQPGRFAFRPRPRVLFESCAMAVCQSHRLYQLAHGDRPGATPMVAWADFEQLVVIPEAELFLGTTGLAGVSHAHADAVDHPVVLPGPEWWLRRADEGRWMVELAQIFERIGSHRFLRKLDQILQVLAVYAGGTMGSACSSSRSGLFSERLHF
mmetsp:Transcript_89554/g.252364  ORF Transcript_89554/g.252364 Transcript_89554/m.252364 type:complete len:700 (-) Transcript_89554:83-2182(-)